MSRKCLRMIVGLCVAQLFLAVPAFAQLGKAILDTDPGSRWSVKIGTINLQEQAMKDFLGGYQRLYVSFYNVDIDMGGGDAHAQIWVEPNGEIQVNTASPRNPTVPLPPGEYSVTLTVVGRGGTISALNTRNQWRSTNNDVMLETVNVKADEKGSTSTYRFRVIMENGEIHVVLRPTSAVLFRGLTLEKAASLPGSETIDNKKLKKPSK
jgi:hypothetical protein